MSKDNEFDPEDVARKPLADNSELNDANDNFPDAKPQDDDQLDDLEFVVTEAHEEGPEFVGLSKDGSTDGDLGLQSTADMMDDLAHSESEPPPAFKKASEEFSGPIGQSEPPLPPAPMEVSSPLDSGAGLNEPQDASPADTGIEPGGLQKLSDSEIKAINEEMYSESSYLSDEEKHKLVQSINGVDDEESPSPEEDLNKPFANTPIEPPKRNTPSPEDIAETVQKIEQQPEMPKPARAQRQRGIAYFYRNFIQIKSIQTLHENDTIQINDREYGLKKKQFSAKFIATVASPIFAVILLIIGMQFVGGITGDGRIVGVVLDEYGQPFLQTAEINFPELGESYESDAQGFFTSGSLPSGSHKMEYLIDGNIVGVDYATVLGDKVTTVALAPTGVEENEIAVEEPAQPDEPVIAEANEPPPPAKKPTTSESKTKSTRKSSNSKSKKSSSKSTSKEAKLRLNATTPGATLAINDKVIGAGNLTYGKLKSGSKSYSVSKDGYETATGTITLKSGKTVTLDVDLTPLTQAAREETYGEEEFYSFGMTSYTDGAYRTAVEEFSVAIKKDPSFADAYFSRAKAYTALNESAAAMDDYVRAAEILQMRGDLNRAILSYNKAVELDPKGIAPLLGRANTYLAKGEEIAAIADYESVKSLDKRNAQARFGIGKARFAQGYYKKAIKELKNARSLDPKNPLVHQYLMLSYMANNEIKNVKKSYDQFQKVATQQQLEQLRTDQKFSAIMKVIDLDS